MKISDLLRKMKLKVVSFLWFWYPSLFFSEQAYTISGDDDKKENEANVEQASYTQCVCALDKHSP